MEDDVRAGHTYRSTEQESWTCRLESRRLVGLAKMLPFACREPGSSSEREVRLRPWNFQKDKQV